MSGTAARDDAECNRFRVAFETVDQIAHGLERRVARHHECAVIEERERQRGKVGVVVLRQALNLVRDQARRRKEEVVRIRGMLREVHRGKGLVTAGFVDDENRRRDELLLLQYLLYEPREGVVSAARRRWQDELHLFVRPPGGLRPAARGKVKCKRGK